MFRNTSIFFCLLFLAACVGVGLSLFRTDPQTVAAFEEIVKSALPKAPSAPTIQMEEVTYCSDRLDSSSRYAELKLDEKKITVRASPIRAEIKEGSELVVTAREALYEGNVLRLIGEVRATGALGQCHADEAHIQCEELKPTFITLLGQVQLMHLERGQFALADKVEYIPATEEATLTGFDGKKVLFFDQKNQMQLAARTVRSCGREQVRGFGDVRLTFQEEELEKLKAKFYKELK